MITVTLNEKGYRAVRRGALSLAAEYVISVPVDVEPGSFARLMTPEGRFLATGYVNPASRIPFRILSFNDEKPDASFFAGRIEAASAFRKRFYSHDEAYRLVYGEADGLPGLVIDRYGTCCVMQITTAGMERCLEAILDALRVVLAPESIILACDALARKKEGLPLYRRIAFGRPEPPLEIYVDKIPHWIDPLSTHKTGFFLDQRENRKRAATFCFNKRVLDLCCFSGAFAIRACHAGAGSVTAVDIFEPGIRLGRFTAERLGYASRCRFIRDETQRFLRSLPEEEEWDVVFLDPPSLVRGRQRSRRNLATYRKWNALALKHVVSGGVFITSCCSYHVTDRDFRDILGEALHEANRDGLIFHTGSISPDHPLRPGSSGSDYLKCLFVHVFHR